MSADTLTIKRDERQWQDSQGGSLQQRAYGRPGTQIVMQRQFMRVAEALDLKPGARLLDLGCGAGLFLSWLVGETNARCYGIDLSLNSAYSARQLSSKMKIVVEVGSYRARIPPGDKIRNISDNAECKSNKWCAAPLQLMRSKLSFLYGSTSASPTAICIFELN